MGHTHYLLTGSRRTKAGGASVRVYFIPTLAERKATPKVFNKLTKGTPPRNGAAALQMHGADHLASGGVLPESEIHVCNSYAEAQEVLYPTT